MAVKRFRADEALQETGMRGPEVVLASDFDKLEAMVRFAWEATLDFRTTYNGRPSNWREAEIATAESLCKCNDALEEYLYPESQSDAAPKPSHEPD